MIGLSQGALQRRTQAQCKCLVYLHRTTGVHYQVTYDRGRQIELTPILGRTRCVTAEELADPEIWSKQ